MTFSRAMPSIFTIPACEAANRCLTRPRDHNQLAKSIIDIATGQQLSPLADRQRLTAMLDGGVGLGDVHGPWVDVSAGMVEG
jgi:hypothetical protein